MKTSSPEDADIIIQKVPCDMGIHRNPRKGTLNAPEKILEDFKLEASVLIDEVFPDEFNLENTQERIEENTEDLIEYDKPLISIGGDHSISFPVIKALKKRYPNLQLVWLDAHLDLKEKVGDHVSHDVVVRELLNHGFSEDEIYFVGITRVDYDEEQFLAGRNFNVYKPDEFDRFLREFNSSEQPVYLSIDIDVLKEDHAPGTGYLDGENNLDDVKNIIKEVQADFYDLVEVAPSLDKNNKTIRSSREILSSIETVILRHR